MENCKVLNRIYHFIIGFSILLFLTVGCQTNNQKSNVKVSEFGKYEGYSIEKYDSWERTSKYITMHDGVKLACDIIRPRENGKLIQKTLPVVWAYYRYHRAVEKDGIVLSLVDRLPPLQTLIKHGYVVVVVDARGTGASFGNESKGPNTLQEAQHTYEITEWIASQDWCDGKVGMFGHSYSGNVQFLAAAQAPPHLKAVFPSGATFDLYEVIYPGGIFSENLAKGISRALHFYDIEMDAVPVDSDSTGLLLKEAKLEHMKNIDAYDFFKELAFRDSRYKDYQFWLEGTPLVYLSDCNVARIPVYQWIGWKDFLIKDALQWFVNLKSPKKLTIGSWSHDVLSSYALSGIEQLRWFDYWLKGIENSIMDEPSIHYTCIDNPDSTEWYQAKTWPIPESQPRKFYFVPGGLENTQPGYRGLLLEKPDLNEKWKNDIPFPESKELTFTTPPLESELFVIGHPVVTLHVNNLLDDLDIILTLQDVDESGNAQQVSKGNLRASHRTLSEPPFNNMNLPYHRHFKADIEPIPIEKSVELYLDLLPVAKCFKSGHRIQVSVSYSDASGSVENRPDDLNKKVITGISLLSSDIVLPLIKH